MSVFINAAQWKSVASLSECVSKLQSKAQIIDPDTDVPEYPTFGTTPVFLLPCLFATAGFHSRVYPASQQTHLPLKPSRGLWSRRRPTSWGTTCWGNTASRAPARERNSWELRGHERTDTNHHQPATSDVNTVNSAFCCRNYTAALVLILLKVLFIAIRMGVLWYSCDENIKKIFGRWNRWVKLHQGC